MSSNTSTPSLSHKSPSSPSALIAQTLDTFRSTQLFAKISSLIADIQRGLNLNSNAQPGVGRRDQQNNWLKPLLLIAAVVVLVVGGRAIISKASGASGGEKVTIRPPRKTIEINREFTFPIRGEEGEESGRVIKYVVEKFELADEIVVKGQRATAVTGRTFLIFSIKLINDEDVGIEIDTRDYIRASVNNSDERLAADIHNDPVEVQPLSTKSTRIGFPTDDNVKHITLFVGEIKGDKEAIEVSL